MTTKIYTFMTGAHQFRLPATSRDEAIQIIMHELAPDSLALSLILHTLREEGLEFTVTDAE